MYESAATDISWPYSATAAARAWTRSPRRRACVVPAACNREQAGQGCRLCAACGAAGRDAVCQGLPDVEHSAADSVRCMPGPSLAVCCLSSAQDLGVLCVLWVAGLPGCQRQPWKALPCMACHGMAVTAFRQFHEAWGGPGPGPGRKAGRPLHGACWQCWKHAVVFGSCVLHSATT